MMLRSLKMAQVERLNSAGRMDDWKIPSHATLSVIPQEVILCVLSIIIANAVVNEI